MIKAVGILKVISALVFLATLLFVYAFLPIMVELVPDENYWSVHKEYFFYGAITVMIVVNLFLLALERMLKPLIRSEPLMAWLKGLGFVLNLYFAFAVGYLGVINNAQHFQESGYAYLNYLGPLLVLGWFVGLIYLIISKSKTA